MKIDLPNDGLMDCGTTKRGQYEPAISYRLTATGTSSRKLFVKKNMKPSGAFPHPGVAGSSRVEKPPTPGWGEVSDGFKRKRINRYFRVEKEAGKRKKGSRIVTKYHRFRDEPACGTCGTFAGLFEKDPRIASVYVSND